MEAKIVEEMVWFMNEDNLESWLTLFKDRKVSRNFINNFITIIQKTDKSYMINFMPEIRKALEEGISEEAIIWLYNPEAEFNKFYSKEIISLGGTLGEEPMKSYWHNALSDVRRNKFKEALKNGLTVEQLSLIATARFNKDEMDEIIKYFKLGVGFNLDFNQSFSIIIGEMKKEVESKLKETLFNI